MRWGNGRVSIGGDLIPEQAHSALAGGGIQASQGRKLRWCIFRTPIGRLRISAALMGRKSARRHRRASYTIARGIVDPDKNPARHEGNSDAGARTTRPRATRDIAYCRRDDLRPSAPKRIMRISRERGVGDMTAIFTSTSTHSDQRCAGSRHISRPIVGRSVPMRRSGLIHAVSLRGLKGLGHRRGRYRLHDPNKDNTCQINDMKTVVLDVRG